MSSRLPSPRSRAFARARGLRRARGVEGKTLVFPADRDAARLPRLKADLWQGSTSVDRGVLPLQYAFGRRSQRVQNQLRGGGQHLFAMCSQRTPLTPSVLRQGPLDPQGQLVGPLPFRAGGRTERLQLINELRNNEEKAAAESAALVRGAAPTPCRRDQSLRWRVNLALASSRRSGMRARRDAGAGGMRARAS